MEERKTAGNASCLVSVYSVDIKLLERELKTLIERNGIISKEICGNKH